MVRPSTRITVQKGGVKVFAAECGRLGVDDSALRDYACFASPIIGAAYHYLSYEDSARRIAEQGYRTTFIIDGRDRSVEACKQYAPR